MNIRCVIPLHLVALSALVVSSALFADVQPQAAAPAVDNMAGNVMFYNGENRACPLVVSGQGHSAIMSSCDYAPIKLVITEMPSTSTLLLTDKTSDCSESTGPSRWWVKLQATARKTSSAELSMRGILDIASGWHEGQSDLYVAPYLRVVGAKVGDGDTRIGCGLLQLPAEDPKQILYTQPLERQPRGENAECGNNILLGLYWQNSNFSYQCANISEANGQPFHADTKTEVLASVGDGPKYCPIDKVVTGIKRVPGFDDRYIFTCSRMINATGTVQLKTLEPQETNRWVSRDEHNTICERPDMQSGAFLLSSSNSFLTGIDFTGNSVRWYCSKVTPETF